MKSIDHKIYLASKNPNRRELLRQIGIGFDLLLVRERPGEIKDAIRADESTEDFVRRLAREKADHAWEVMLWRKLPMRPVLAADTKLAVDGRILGKPADAADAMQMLETLSGRTHQVLTSIAIRSDEGSWQATKCTDVTFATLSAEMIRSYCSRQEYRDKAGAYAIQGHASSFICDISGSYSCIMGLPLHETGQLLQKAGIPVL
ncbi:MAG: nucleoside triphosphate pyrophosphatase [Burkholderiales bacterium]